ncbi:MAG: hypothetical protein HFI81_05210 [Eubacterium sp.]|jgi:hypothetical protein|nr:hypothetical protein [Eubacterium sp.]
MAVGPVTLNGMIPRTQDVSALKQNEDNKPLVEQQNIQVQLKHQEDRQLKQVNHADDANQQKKKYDAKEKGSNEYHGQQKKKKKQDEKNKVIYKQESGRFDMKI